jgi:hypothetical protein
MPGMPSQTPRWIIVICIAMLLAFAQTARAEPAALEKLLTAKPTKTGLTLTVSTGGCTKKSDFEITSHRLKRHVASVEVRRLAPDTCKGNFPEGTKLSFSWSELRVRKHSKILIKNPIVHTAKSGDPLRRNSVHTVVARRYHREAAKSWQPSAWQFLRIPN